MDLRRKAFSLVELILVVLFVGILAAISVPRLNFGIVSKQKADVIANRIATDLRRTRSLAISNAATNSLGVVMDMLDPAPYKSYVIKNLAGNKVIATVDIDDDISCSGSSLFSFKPNGSLVNAPVQLKVTGGGRSFTITVIGPTGMVKCVEN